MANSLATAVECLVLLEILRKRLKGLEGRQILNTSLQALLGSVVMGLALFGWITLFGDRNKYIVLVGGVFIGLLAYVAMMLLLKVPELQTIILRIRSKLARRG